ncbi:DNA translocase FtsK 4TM domain-containing protein [Peptostreptococcus stomatis]|uniref:FtsK/SpoIIIE family DNA translocase n=1 Tax=Peptostreptococcus stomatis TaxID=341694 RepID=UPI003FA0D080
MPSKNSRQPGRRSGPPAKPVKNKKSRKQNKKGKTGLRINGEYQYLILVFLGLFFAYGLMSSSSALIPRIIQLLCKGMFGGLAMLIPLTMVVMGITGILEGNEKIDRLKKTKIFYIFVLFIVIYYGLINYARTPSESPFSLDMIQDIVKMGVSREGVGLIPSILTYLLSHLLGFVGAWLLTIFATILTILYFFEISVKDIIAYIKNPKDSSNIINKIRTKFGKKAKIDGVDDKTMLNKTGFFERIRDKFHKNEEVEDYEDEVDDDKTIKIVGFNKAEDDYLEILEGTQGLSDLEILQQMQKEEPIIDGLVTKEDEDLSNKRSNKLLQLDDEEDTLGLGQESNLEASGASLPKRKMTGLTEDVKMGHIPTSKTYVEEDDKLIPENEHEKYKNYKMPPISLLNKLAGGGDKKSKHKVLENARRLEKTLRDFGVDANINQVTVGPTITRYEIQPNPGVKVSKIVNLTDDIALSLAAKSIRMEAPIPGKSAIGIEVPNDELQMVSVREIIDSDEFKNFKSPLVMGLGKDVAGRIIVGDIGKMPHLLIAGSTGSGKSVCVNTLITSIMYKAKPDEVKLMLIDPKVVELANYNGIPHLLVPVVTDAKKAANALGWAVSEMNRRYKLFAENQVKDISSYNEKSDDPLPKIVIIIDELADLMMVSANDVEDHICRLAQMARAAGMHLIVATQRPSVDVITGVIKANIPSRIAFAVSSQTDSRTILDMGGAEKLLGKGDMLFYPLGAAKPVRLQGAFISEAESENIIDYVKKEAGEISYAGDIEESISSVNTERSGDEDELLYDAITFVVANGQASSSMLQRKYKIGFNRAARLIDNMEERGIVGPSEGSKPRKVLISKEELSAFED